MVTILQEESCSNCQFYMASPHVCRRHPPVPILLGVEQASFAGMQPKPVIQAYFPNMMPNGWCGEHRPIDQPEIEN